MRILLAHNHYQLPGGEDRAFEAEARLLRRHGHEVTCHTVDNRRIDSMRPLELFGEMLWSRRSAAQVTELIERHRPEVAHFHNTFPLLSPSVYAACRKRGVAVVQTLHNFRLLCPQATFYRRGQICESCLGKTLPWPAVVHRCYRQSLTASAGLATFLVTHRTLRTYSRHVDAYIVLGEFARLRFLEGGLPPEKLHHKSNFLLDDPGPGEHGGGFALFVGRLSEEKGVPTLLEAWSRSEVELPLRLVGDGLLASEARERAGASGGKIEVLGEKSHAEVLELMGQARLLVLPSPVYENQPLSLIEAFATGLPALVSRVGPLELLVEPGRTGLHFEPGNPGDLAARVVEIQEGRVDLEALGRGAREEFEARYTARASRERLEEIYDLALENLGRN